MHPVDMKDLPSSVLTIALNLRGVSDYRDFRWWSKGGDAKLSCVRFSGFTKINQIDISNKEFVERC